MADSPRKFGRYFLLDLLAQGGMAEIYRARLASSDGAGRIIVIKRIQAGHGADHEFLQMFRSEIKVTMGFNHPNIVQLYDFGEEAEQPYIAMEWVDGKNLRQFMARFIDLKQRFPIDLASQIIEQAASGLQYAHHFKDKISGEHLNIVHRDISPQNIIIAFEGSVKVIDFGIAKATVNSEATRAGVIKGKPSYLSPEQINGDVLDGRSDIFSLGTVLWELLAGRKLFSGDTDLAILKQIESCNTFVKPPSTINPDVPPDLDYIVLKALAKQRDKRYQTAEEFQRALHKFLYSHAPDFNPSDLAYYAKDLFKKEIVEDRKKIQRLNDEVERLLSSVMVANAPLTLDERSGGDSTEIREKTAAREDETVVATKAKPSFTVYEGVSEGEAPRVEMDRSISSIPPPRYRSASSTGSFSISRGAKTSTKMTRATRSKSLPTAKPQGISAFKVGASIAAVLGGIIIFGKDLGLPIPDFRNSSDVPVAGPRPASDELPKPSEPISAEAPQTKPKSVVLRLNLSPGGGAPVITLNGQRVDPEKPMIRVPLDQLLELSVERKGYKPYNSQFYIESARLGDVPQWNKEVPLEPAEFGTLYITTTPSAEAKIMMDGKPWILNTPFANEINVPVGTYLIEMTNKGLGMGKTIKVKIEKGQTIRLEERLEILDK